MTQKRKRLWALLLSAALVTTQLPAVVLAENKTPEDGAVASFAALPDTVKAQTVPTGTEESELGLPKELSADVYRVTEEPPAAEDTGIPDTDGREDETGEASPDSGMEDSTPEKDAGQETDSGSRKTVSTATEQIPVTWSSAPAYDGGVEGNYVFTADTGRYALSNGVMPPQITVTVAEEIEDEETETRQEELDPCTKTEGCTLREGHEGGCFRRRMEALQKPSPTGHLRTAIT